MRSVPYADIWVPYTTAKTDAYKREVMGDWNAIALARDEAAMAGIHEEFNSRLLRVELPDEGLRGDRGPVRDQVRGFARLMPTADRKDPESQVWRMVTLLLVLAAAVHPHSHRQPGEHQHQPDHGAGVGDRRPQGIRCAVAHAGWTVPRREHPADTDRRHCWIRAVHLRAARIAQSGLFSYAHFTVNLRVFAYGMALAVVFGLISGVYPAWRMSRLNPVQALKGGPR